MTQALLQGEELRLVLVLHYYDVLNADPDWKPGEERQRFPEALAELFSQECNESNAREFAARWRLPPGEGPGDVLCSYEQWWLTRERSPGVEPELIPGPRGYMKALVGSVTRRWVPAPREGQETTRFQVTEPIPMIVPKGPAPFLYDPTDIDARQRLLGHLDELLRTIRADILAQAEALEEQAKRQGYVALGPRRRGKSARVEFEKRARRLYRRAVCGLGYDAIADLEDEARDADAVRKSVQLAAKTLGVRLRR